jgi:hypothetical protein
MPRLRRLKRLRQLSFFCTTHFSFTSSLSTHTNEVLLGVQGPVFTESYQDDRCSQAKQHQMIATQGPVCAAAVAPCFSVQESCCSRSASCPSEAPFLHDASKPRLVVSLTLPCLCNTGPVFADSKAACGSLLVLNVTAFSPISSLSTHTGRSLL